MDPFTSFTSRVVPLPLDNIDTDQIYPGRFLRVTTRDGLADMLFADWRFAPDGSPRPDFVLNQPRYQGARVLLAGDNFGCGSSREHAPWALVAYGFRAVISTSFADIFRNNALKNGLLPIAVDPTTHRELLAAVTANPEAAVVVDLASQTLRLPDGRAIPIPIDPFSKRCLLEGMDELGYLLSTTPAIQAYEASHVGRVNTLQDRG
jgi:3-isopropylmalate/(R)-2-methylmalate dehydratase small subunit